MDTRTTTFSSYESYLQGLHVLFSANPATDSPGVEDGAPRRAGAARSPVRREVGARFRDLPEAPELIVVPPGQFLMGAGEADHDRMPFEVPQHVEQIQRPFAVGVYPVTFDEWDACVADGGVACQPPDSCWGRGRMPVINVSWNDVQDYLVWLGRKTGARYRLLTEAEFEYLARAGVDATRFPWGHDERGSQLADYAWFRDNAGGRTQQVGGKPANAFGLCDLLGNVSEWVADAWHPDYRAHPGDGRAVESTQRAPSRVIRGGSWLDPLRMLRPSVRDRQSPTHRSYRVGFRVARDL